MSKYKLKFLVTDEDTLHQKSSKVLPNSRAAKEAKAALEQLYERQGGRAQGFAAIQVGLPVNVILLRYHYGEKYQIVYNAEVLRKIGRRKSNEGCASEGDIRYIVYRPWLAKVSYQTEDCVKHVEWLPYRKARIFCHEYDHTEGILLKDHGRIV